MLTLSANGQNRLIGRPTLEEQAIATAPRGTVLGSEREGNERQSERNGDVPSGAAIVDEGCSSIGLFLAGAWRGRRRPKQPQSPSKACPASEDRKNAAVFSAPNNARSDALAAAVSRTCSRASSMAPMAISTSGRPRMICTCQPVGDA